MATKVGFVGKSDSVPCECNLECEQCQITSKIVTWLTSLYELHPDTKVLNFRFTTNHDVKDNMGCCIHMIAQLEWKE